MRRADRLFIIVDLLRPARLMTAGELARRLEVSVRTIYRDIADLIGAGVPITGEAGAGYLMRPGYDLPPLMLTRSEAAALMAGARMLRAYAGGDLGRAAGEAMDKISAVMPPDVARGAADLPLFAIPGRDQPQLPPGLLAQIEAAIAARITLQIAYLGLASGAQTQRWVEPAALFFWGQVWTLAAHCHLRGDLRMFRLDRLQVLGEGPRFPAARAQALARAVTLRHAGEGGLAAAGGQG
jgi:predicted DNA-binding transcriptional regulator YafY